MYTIKAHVEVEVSSTVSHPGHWPQVSGQFHAWAGLLLGKSLRSLNFVEDNDLLATPGIEHLFLCRPSSSLDTVPTELSRIMLRYQQFIFHGVE